MGIAWPRSWYSSPKTWSRDADEQGERQIAEGDNDPGLYGGLNGGRASSQLSKDYPKHGAGSDNDTQDQQCFEERAHFPHRLQPLMSKIAQIGRFVNLGAPYIERKIIGGHR
jgi:hypothetical protein